MNPFITKFNKSKLKAFTLTELMVVLVIIGVLMLVALPVFDGLFGDAYSIEAQNQLRYIQSRQQTYYQKNFQFTEDFQALGFTPPKSIFEEGESRYSYEIIKADRGSFLAKATAVADFDNDGQINIWQINEDGSPSEIMPD